MLAFGNDQDLTTLPMEGAAMRAIVTDDPGVSDKRFTVTGNEGVEYGAFDTQEEVLEVVKRLPNGTCTIRFGTGVGFDSAEAWELRKKIEGL